MANLIESYKNRMAISESVYRKAHNGQPMDNNRKLVIAACLNNVSKFMNEAFENSMGTQRSAMGEFKRFCINLTNVALPSLIAPEIVLTVPMSSFVGNVTYLNYVAGSNKGGVKQKDLFNGVWQLPPVDENRQNYTSAAVVESATIGAAEPAAHAITVAPLWTPLQKITGVKITDVTAENAVTVYSIVAAGEEVADVSCSVKDEVITFADGDTKFVQNNIVTFGYLYDNVIIPQNDLPTLNAEIKNITLEAKARRIAVYYSQIAAYQAKTDYGFDLGENLATQAAAELSYEIDTEVVNLLVDHAGATAVTFNRPLPPGVSMTEHYASFSEAIAKAKAILYKRTGKFVPNYMLIAANILPILGFVRTWTPAPVAQVNGPYFAGTVDGVKVFVSPAIADDKFVLGVNGSDMMTSAAVYAPYMPIVPTQLLQYADGGTSQGFSTMYDLKLLSTDADGNSPLLIAGAITNEPVAVNTKVVQ